MRTDNHVDRATQAERPNASDEAVDDMIDAMDDIEKELREQASGSQDGYLLDVANRMRAALANFR